MTETPEGTTPAFTIHVAEGTLGVMQRVMAHLEGLRLAVELAGTVEEKREKEDALRESYRTWTHGLHRVLSTTEHDGDVHLYPEMWDVDGLSLGFTYEKSGFQGGLNFRGAGHGKYENTWSVNT